MEDSSFVFDHINFIDIKFNQIDLVRGRTYVKTPVWISKNKATINTKNENDEKCLMYAITVALNHQEIGEHPERISRRLLEQTLKYNWNNISKKRLGRI